MGDVHLPGRSVDDIFLVLAAGRDHDEQHRRDEPWTGHPPMRLSHARRIGVFGQSAQCQECGTICMANHERGAYVGPPGDPWGHAFPWRVAQPAPEPEGATQPTNLPAPTFASDSKRPSGIPAGLPHRPKPTRELRKYQQQRARAKERGEPITPDMFVSTKAYARWRRRYGRDGDVMEAPSTPKPPKVKRLRFLTPTRPQAAVEPEEPYIETTPDWDDIEMSAALAEAEENLAKLRATPEKELK